MGFRLAGRGGGPETQGRARRFYGPPPQRASRAAGGISELSQEIGSAADRRSGGDGAPQGERADQSLSDTTGERALGDAAGIRQTWRALLRGIRHKLAVRVRIKV